MSSEDNAQLGTPTDVGARLRAAREAKQISLREMASPPQLAALEAGEIHVAFVRPPVPDARMSIRLVHTDPFMIALPDTHPKAGQAGTFG